MKNLSLVGVCAFLWIAAEFIDSYYGTSYVSVSLAWCALVVTIIVLLKMFFDSYSFMKTKVADMKTKVADLRVPEKDVMNKIYRIMPMKKNVVVVFMFFVFLSMFYIASIVHSFIIIGFVGCNLMAVAFFMNMAESFQDDNLKNKTYRNISIFMNVVMALSILPIYFGCLLMAGYSVDSPNASNTVGYIFLSYPTLIVISFLLSIVFNIIKRPQISFLISMVPFISSVVYVLLFCCLFFFRF